MKILYILILFIIVISLTYYFYNNQIEHYKSINKFKFINSDESYLSDDFGDIIRENILQKNDIHESILNSHKQTTELLKENIL
jgi:hypothetical protein